MEAGGVVLHHRCRSAALEVDAVHREAERQEDPSGAVGARQFGIVYSAQANGQPANSNFRRWSTEITLYTFIDGTTRVCQSTQRRCRTTMPRNGREPSGVDHAGWRITKKYSGYFIAADHALP
jgi:hypothetical protein